jgi:peroxiredoxin
MQPLDPTILPADLPIPADDGACRHLPNMVVPPISLAATDGTTVDLAAPPGAPGPERTVVYAYPRTGRPGVPLPSGWDAIPGARGCTPESCGFRDRYADMAARRVRVFGLSTQTADYQREMVARLHLPFAVLSDADMRLTQALRLPTLAVDGMALIRRLTLVIRGGRIEHVFYPVFPPDRHAAEVIAWLDAHPLGTA